jgi:DNA-binding transcriptional LysR family regulator
MDTVQNLRAFMEVAQRGSFSAAGRKLGIATSVVAKRVGQLEARTKTQLFRRSTRAVTLTEAGQAWIGRVRPMLTDIDELLAGARTIGRELEGPLRIKAPTTLSILYLGAMLASFQVRHPKIVLDIVLTDRPVNPTEEGFDLALAVFGSSFTGVTDVPLCPVRRLLCATPGYLSARGTPDHPRDLPTHDTLSFSPTGHVWVFSGPQGQILVEVSPRFSANDGQLLVAAARAGNGIALVSEYVALPLLKTGELVTVLQDFPVPDIWLKALVPNSRMQVRRIQALLRFLQDSFLTEPPWSAIRRGSGERGASIKQSP